MRLIDADALIIRIVNHTTKIPGSVSILDLKAWLYGYGKCQHNILDIVEDMPTVGRQQKPKRESLAMLPCKCGYNRREHWLGSGEKASGLVCKKCGFEVWGKNDTDVIRRWNEAVKQDETD